ncbi:hypothetical protein PAT3040_03087 [Paenibacillus agaridevorans]|uniref:DNA-binding response regulator n=1 Tax=Paenibacillus agaridevorans TaxID=171404 RepID=A0A2R5EYP2_9BACL|nr:response regulator [Paenibacillus agaridevorans]GBG08501.1 hypothetical protein PAT3040_03087 [Paenibacillus agaridevorans]
MNRLLIVDNEDYVVNGLIEVISQLSHLELEVIGAYSAREALDWLKRTKIDIVVSDIRMPGMDGITLQQEIMRYWPKCKVIFLSGFNDFDYVQNAIRGGALDYVLKTDGDERLIEAVEKAVAKLRDEIEIESLIVKSKNQMRMAFETLQQDFIRQLLQGERLEERELSKQFADLHIPLQPSMPVLAIIGRVDEWMENVSHYDRYLLLYSIRNIAGEYLDTMVTQISLPVDRFNIVWMIQPKSLQPSSSLRVQEDTWSMIIRFVQGTFEMIQAACKDLIKLDLSVLIADTPVGWAEVGSKFALLRSNLARGLGSGRKVLMIDQQFAGNGTSESPLPMDAASLIGNLASMLENNRRELFFDLLDELLLQRDSESQEKHYFMAVSVILSFHTKELKLCGSDERWDIGRLIFPDLMTAPHDAADYLRKCAESIFDFRERSRGESENELMMKVKTYIADHLTNDLSLTIIAETVSHNSSYLSRLFKQNNGVGIAEYITDCRIRLAKELLEDPGNRIQDIPAAIGFTSVQYFYRVFKKVTGKTPQEWREASV